MTYRMYKKQKEDLKTDSPGLFEEMGLESDDDDMQLMSMTEWPDFFDVDKVDEVRKTELKPKPKL